MSSYSELTRAKIIVINDQPYEITEALSTFKGRGHSYLQMKLRNLINGNVISKSASREILSKMLKSKKKKPNSFLATKENTLLLMKRIKGLN